MRTTKVCMTLFILLICFVCFPAGTGISQTSTFSDYLNDFRTIPGVTQQEITAIEAAIKRHGGTFSYGNVHGSEAFITRDGVEDGFSKYFCELLSGMFGAKFSTTYHEWDDLLAAISDNTLDFTGELTATSERRRTYFMTDTFHNRTIKIFTNRNAEKLNILALERPLRYAALDGVVTGAQVKNVSPFPFDLVNVPNYATAIEGLQNLTIDAFLEEDTAVVAFAEVPFIRTDDYFPLIYSPVSFSTVNPELEPFISVMDKFLKHGGREHLDHLYKQGTQALFRHLIDIEFTDEERKFIKKHKDGNIRIPFAAHGENYPISFYSKADKKFQGIALDVLNAISEITGLTFEPIHLPKTTTADLKKILAEGGVTLITGVTAADRKGSPFLWTRDPYSSGNYSALISTASHPSIELDKILNTRVGLIEGTVYERIYNVWFPGNTNSVVYPNPTEAFAALQEEKIDFIMGARNVLLSQTNYLEQPHFKAALIFDYDLPVHFVLNSNAHPLHSILDKAQKHINLKQINNHWVSRVYDYNSKILYDIFPYLCTFIAVLGVLLAFTIFVFIKNKQLSKNLERQIFIRTQELYKTTEELKEHSGTLQAVFSSIPDHIVCRDLNGTITQCNESFLNFLDKSHDEVIGLNAEELFVTLVENYNEHRILDAIVMQTGNISVAEESIFSVKFQAKRIYEVIKAPILYLNESVGLISIARDITERKAVEAAAREASLAKSSFLAQMSHEIRTPMNAISGMTELILHENTTDSVLGHASNIRNACQGLLAIINDILDISKIESGNLEIVPTRYHFSALLTDVISIIKVRTDKQALTFIVNIDADIPGELYGDELRIKQVLINLPTNAVKFTSEGKITFTVSSKTEDDTCQLTFSIADTGMGIKPGDIQKIFMLFQQVDTKRNRNIEGTGLGLSISRQLVEMMGGTLTVESEFGVGSTFTVTMRQNIASSEPVVVLKHPEQTSVLIYETRPDYLGSVIHALDPLGCPYTVCSNRSDMHTLLDESTYNYIFISSLYINTVQDIAVQKQPHATIVVINSDGNSYHKGTTIFISMPIHCLLLANIFNNEHEGHGISIDSAHIANIIAPTAKVLVVDDNAVNLKVAVGLMKLYKIQADTASNGMRAVEMVRETDYDIIFMDHMMPEMDGIDTTIAIRSLGEKYTRIPIIALTANAVSGVKEMFKAEGLNDFLPKPIEMAKLDAIVKKWLPKNTQQSREEPVPSKEAVYDIPGVNTRKGIRNSGGVLENYIDILDIYATDCENRLPEINKLHKEGDIKALTICIHAIKSASANIGADELSAMAMELEEAGKAGNTRYIDANLRRFTNSLRFLLNTLQNTLSSNRAKEVTPERATDFAVLKSTLSEIVTHMGALDLESIENSVRQLQPYHWDEVIAVEIAAIKDSITIFDYDAVEKAIERLKAICGEG